MKNSLKQEFYKFRHQRIPLYGAIALLVLMLYSAVSASGSNRMLIAQGFGAGQWLTIIMIAIASTFVAMEYQNRTIMTLFYKNSNKSAIYFAKFIVMLIYGALMSLLGLVLTFILKAVMVGSKYSWGAMYGQHSLLIDLLLNTAGFFIYPDLKLNCNTEPSIQIGHRDLRLIVTKQIKKGLLYDPDQAYYSTTLPTTSTRGTR